jgi:methylthioxylose transferase
MMCSRRRLAAVAIIVVAVAIVVFGLIVGTRLNSEHPLIKLGAGPLVGAWRWRFGWRTLPPICIAVAVVWLGIERAAQTSWNRLLIFVGATTSAFTIALAATDGRQGLLGPVEHPTEYWAQVKTFGNTRQFVETYLDRLNGYSVHLRGHPPGFAMLLLTLRHLGLGSAWVAGMVSWLAAGMTAVFVLVTVRRFTDERTARLLAPFLVVAPYAIWEGTSADSCYAAVCAGGIAALAIAVAGSGHRQLWAAGSGVLFGLAIFGTYGAALVAPIALVVVVVKRGWRVIPAVVAGGGAVVVGFALAGFWWFDGVLATQRQYWDGTARYRIAGYFAVFNIAALLLAVGPVVVLGLARLRRVPWTWLVGAALCAVAISDASQYTKGEVERIWLLFMPWLTVACLGFVERARSRRLAIASQAVWALTLQSILVSKW